ncbi:hypothetical protein RYX36_030040, partial [Vicia faba]
MKTGKSSLPFTHHCNPLSSIFRSRIPPPSISTLTNNCNKQQSTIVKEPVGIVYSENSSNSNNLLRGERVVSRVLSTTNEEGRVKGENSIEHVTYEEVCYMEE